MRALSEKIGLFAKTRRGKVGKVAKNKGKFSKKEAGVDYPESSGDGKKEYGK